MSTTVAYHKDADGYCSAAIAKMAGIEGDYIAMEYGEEFPKIPPRDHTVYLLDYCLQPFDLMINLNALSTLYWIDHHKSAIKAAAKTDFEASGGQLTATGLAACELTWMYFFPNKRMPDWVHLIGRYDVWDHRLENTVSFHYGLLSRDLDPGINGWGTWLCLRDSPRDMMEAIINEGKAIQRYTEQRYATIAKSAAFEVDFNGLKFIAVNVQKTGSKIADSVWDAEKYDAIMTFAWANGQWNIGLYTDKPGVDVSKVAVRHGGGGHRSAAGFQCKYLPFELK